MYKSWKNWEVLGNLWPFRKVLEFSKFMKVKMPNLKCGFFFFFYLLKVSFLRKMFLYWLVIFGNCCRWFVSLMRTISWPCYFCIWYFSVKRQKWKLKNWKPKNTGLKIAQDLLKSADRNTVKAKQTKNFTLIAMWYLQRYQNWKELNAKLLALCSVSCATFDAISSRGS